MEFSELSFCFRAREACLYRGLVNVLGGTDRVF
jgi:hypothetical protein